MIEYPCWMYSVDGPILVRSAEQKNALNGDWFDSPAKVPAAKPKKEEIEQPEMPETEEIPESLDFVTVEKGELIAECERQGIDVDKRWGVKKLQEVLASKK